MVTDPPYGVEYDPDFRDELDRGTTEANAKVAQSLFQMATQGKNVAAAIFWMKARAGWREKQEVDANLRTDMRAIHVVSGVPRAADQMTDAELEAIARGGRRGQPQPKIEVEIVRFSDLDDGPKATGPGTGA